MGNATPEGWAPSRRCVWGLRPQPVCYLRVGSAEQLGKRYGGSGMPLNDAATGNVACSGVGVLTGDLTPATSADSRRAAPTG